MISFDSIANIVNHLPNIWYVQYIINMPDGSQQSDFIKYKNELPSLDIVTSDIQKTIELRNTPLQIEQ